MTSTVNCDSCGMPIESGHYCQYCADADGNLQSFETRFDGMKAWVAGQTPSATPAEVERTTLEYMATMPAWADHPQLAALRANAGQ